MWLQKRAKLSSGTPPNLVLKWKREGSGRYSGKTITVKLDLDSTGLRKEGNELKGHWSMEAYIMFWGEFHAHPITCRTSLSLSAVGDSGHARDVES